MSEYFGSFEVDDDDLARGLADGSLAVDTRLRDALRRIPRDGERDSFLQPGDGPTPLRFPHSDVKEDAAYAGEASVLAGIDGVVRAEGRVDALEERVAALERGALGRLRARGRELVARTSDRHRLSPR
jgi:hypothetical protein